VLRHLERQLAYDEWANREMLEALRAAAAPPAAALRPFFHVLGTERLWWSRIAGTPSPVAVWPELSLDQCAELIDALRTTSASFFAAASPEALARSVSYVNSKGERWTSVVGDILQHVVIHSAYHRGQVAAALRAGGHAPPATDHIHWIREGIAGRRA
jgi:uncharacterized damage-inducible protein DinB